MNSFYEHFHIDPSSFAAHVLSFLAWVGALLGVFPAVAGVAALVWYMIQIYESETCQQFLLKRRSIAKSKKIAKLKAEQKVLLAELEALEVVREARVVADAKVAVAAHEAATMISDEATKRATDALDDRTR